MEFMREFPDVCLIVDTVSSFSVVPIAMDAFGIDVLLTGSVGSPDVEGVDADAVISKPFTLEQLTGTVGRLVVRNRPEAR